MQSRCLRWTPVVLAAAYLLPLGVRPLGAPDEVRYAEISREMIASGDWIVPHFLGLRYFEKPVLGYWITSLSELLFGPTTFAVRFPSALSALLSAMIVGWFSARASAERNCGHAAASIYLSFLIVFMLGTTSVLDNVLTLWMIAAMAAFHEAMRAHNGRVRLAFLVLFGVCCGLGFLTKGAVALAVPVLAIVPFMLWDGRWRELIGWGCTAVVAAALVALPWALAIASREGDFWHYFFWEEHVRRFAGGDAQHAQPFWFFLPVAIVGAMPWTFAVPAASRALRGQIARTPPRARLVRYLLLWLVMPFIFFSIARGKLLTYILPCFAPAAILLASGLAGEAASTQASRPLRATVWANVLAAGLLAATVVGIALQAEQRGEAFTTSEWQMTTGLVLALLACAATAWFARRRPLPAIVCNLSLVLLPLMLALPFVQSFDGRWGRTPGAFIEAQAQAHLVGPHTVVLSDDVALAGALGWYLARSDIILYDTSGELAYGLGYPEGASRRVTQSDFARWLEDERVEHDVVLFRSGAPGDSPLPADVAVRAGRYSLYLYRGRY